MNISVLGSAKEIGATAILLEISSIRILLDAGFHPRRIGEEGLPYLEPLSDGVDCICISHAHLDHIGSLPLIAGEHPEAEILMSHPTRTIGLRLLHNTVNVMSIQDEKYPDISCQLFYHEDVEALHKRVRALHFGSKYMLRRRVEVQGVSAGHVLGATGFFIQTKDVRIFYTGDISFDEQELVHGADLPHRKVDILISECTYANDPSSSELYAQEEDRLVKDIVEILSQGGAVLMPVFALGKTQEMLAKLYRMKSEQRIPDVPIYVSGLGRVVSRIYNKYTRYLRREGLPPIPLDRVGEVIDGYEKSSVRMLLNQPCIILATSGMIIEDTPSAIFAEEMIRSERHGIFLVGYVDPDLLGWRILNAKVGDQIDFGGRLVTVKCPNIRRYGFTSHAFRDQLLKMIEWLDPEHIVLVHGEEDGMHWMREKLSDSYTVFTPDLGEIVQI